METAGNRRNFAMPARKPDWRKCPTSRCWQALQPCSLVGNRAVRFPRLHRANAMRSQPLQVFNLRGSRQPWSNQQLKCRTGSLAQYQLFLTGTWHLLAVHFHSAPDLLESARARGDHIPPRAAQKNRTFLIGAPLQNRYYVDKTLERFQVKNCGNLRLLPV
jgi:hypothetical protein